MVYSVYCTLIVCGEHLNIYAYMYIFLLSLQPGTPHRDWKSYFDYIIVDAKKPQFFTEGTMLREVDEVRMLCG